MKMAFVMFWSVIDADERDSLASIIQSFYCTVLDRNSMIYFPLSADVHQEIIAVLVPYTLAGNLEITTAALQCLKIL